MSPNTRAGALTSTTLGSRLNTAWQAHRHTQTDRSQPLCSLLTHDDHRWSRLQLLEEGVERLGQPLVRRRGLLLLLARRREQVCEHPATAQAEVLVGLVGLEVQQEGRDAPGSHLTRTEDQGPHTTHRPPQVGQPLPACLAEAAMYEGGPSCCCYLCVLREWWAISLSLVWWSCEGCAGPVRGNVHGGRRELPGGALVVVWRERVALLAAVPVHVPATRHLMREGTDRHTDTQTHHHEPT